MTEADLDSLDYWRAELGPAFPRYAPSPTPGARHELALAERASRLLGHPLLPWQRYFFRVATELKEDGTYRYETVTVTLPRQAGKTHVLHTLNLLRALKRPHERIYHTAQTQKDAREHALNFQDLLLRKLPASKVKTNRAAGGTFTQFPNGSRVSPFQPSAEGLHGYTSGLITLDEIFSLTEEEGILLLGAVIPTQQTIKHRQLVQFSTQGTASSGYLNQLIQDGRDGTEAFAYFEWSADSDADPYSPDTWQYHPALGHTITEEDIQRAADTLSRGEFIRSMLNLRTAQESTLFKVTDWDKCKGTLTTPNRSRVAVAFEVAHDQSRAAIVGAWRDDDGRTHFKVIRNGFGVDWLPSTLLTIREGRPLAVGTDKVAQNMQFEPELLRSKSTFELHALTPAGIRTGSVSFATALEQGRLVHDGHSSLRNAVASAQSRPLGEGWSISHRSSPEVVAAIVALRLLDEVRPQSKPISRFS